MSFAILNHPSSKLGIATLIGIITTLLILQPNLPFLQWLYGYDFHFIIGWLILGLLFFMVDQINLMFWSFSCCALMAIIFHESNLQQLERGILSQYSIPVQKIEARFDSAPIFSRTHFTHEWSNPPSEVAYRLSTTNILKASIRTELAPSLLHSNHFPIGSSSYKYREPYHYFHWQASSTPLATSIAAVGLPVNLHKNISFAPLLILSTHSIDGGLATENTTNVKEKAQEF